MGINGPRILVAGQSGQLAHALGSLGRQKQAEIIVLGRPIIDIADRASVDRALVACNPDIVINAAAYTAVDRAEQDSTVAFRVNGLGAGNVAEAAAARYIPVIHVSTDYVFDGLKATAYTEDDRCGEDAPFRIDAVPRIDIEAIRTRRRAREAAAVKRG